MADCTPTRYFIRHAEVVASGVDKLSQVGRERANALVAMLQHAGIGAIVATKAERSQKTAEPLATALQIEPQIVTVDPSLSEANAATVLEMIEALDEATPTLVIGHSNTLPLIINQLLGPSNIAIGHDEFDHMFVQAGGGLAHLRYHP